MFRQLRRKNKEISIDETKKILRETRIGVLAVNGDEGYPYAISINFYYDEDAQKIFFHGARAGHKIDSLKKCDKVCFTAMGPEEFKDEPWAPYVKSVVVFGRCHLMEEDSVANARLRQVAEKYYPDEAAINEEMVASSKAVQMYVIEIEHMTGKEIQER